jgi:dihydroorotase
MSNFRISGARVWGEKNTRSTPVLVQNDSMVESLPDGAPAQSLAFDDGCTYIAPGFIDTHGHVYKHVGGDFALHPDDCGVRQGATAVVDQGGPSCLNIDAFRYFVAKPATSRTYCFISTYLMGGIQGHAYASMYGPDKADVQLVVEAIDKNRDLVSGIKTHASQGGFSRWGTALLEKSRQMSDLSGVPFYVHLGYIWPPVPGSSYDSERILTEVGELMRPADVLSHPFRKRDSGILLREGGIHPVFLSAKERGLRIDVGRGISIDYEVARRVLDGGVLPDTLGSDMHAHNTGPGAPPERRFNLFYAMTEMAALGIPLDHVVDMVTRNAVGYLPASERSSDAGGPGLTIFKVVRKRHTLTDTSGNSIEGEVVFYPVGSILDGVFHRVDDQNMPSRLREAVAIAA